MSSFGTHESASGESWPKHSAVDDKCAEIRSYFSRVAGSKLVRYETAELLLDNGTWTPWPDLPIRLYTESGEFIAVAWSEFDLLWIRADLSLPFDPGNASVRWVPNSIEKINAAVGQRIGSIMLGRGQMSVEGKEVEIWTRLIVQVGECWLEIFNALDENGYDIHVGRPAGIFIKIL